VNDIFNEYCFDMLLGGVEKNFFCILASNVRNKLGSSCDSAHLLNNHAFLPLLQIALT